MLQYLGCLLNPVGQTKAIWSPSSCPMGQGSIMVPGDGIVVPDVSLFGVVLSVRAVFVGPVICSIVDGSEPTLLCRVDVSA